MSLESKRLSRVSLWALAGALCGLFLPAPSATAQSNCLSPLVVRTTADIGCGSLRDAINYSNSLPGPNTITFNIPGSGVHLIQLLSGLPEIFTTVTIDGYSQGDNAVVLIQIDGSQINGVSDGLRIGFAPNSLVRGLSLTNFLGYGISVLFSNCTVQGNVIAFNGSGGVLIACIDGCLARADGILGNSIFSNGGLGISLGGGASPLPNDDCDLDSGNSVANDGQNYPVITSATLSGGSTTIQGTLNSAPFNTYHVEFFANSACDPSGYGEGQTFVGSTDVSTDGFCNGSFSFTVPSTLSGFVTATATDSSNNTSEFSPCLTVTSGACVQSAPPPHLIIDNPIAPQGSTATLTWDPPSQGFAGTYLVKFSTDGGATFGAFSTVTGNHLTFAVQFPVGTTVIFEVLANPGCGPDGVSDPSPTVSMQVVQTCPKAGDPEALMDQVQVAVGDAWSLHWTATLPGPASAPAGVYEIRISRDNGLTYQVAGTTTATTFTGGPVPQVDLGKLIFLQVIARPSCGTATVGAGHSNVVFFSVLPGCEGPQAPRNPHIAAVGKHLGDPIFPTDQLSVSWDAPASGNPPSGYLFRINGDIESLVTGGTGTITRARGNGDPMTLFVRSVACSPQKGSAAVQSAPVALSLSPPGANFSISASPKVGSPVTFTDTSSPQATGWLWLFDDGTRQTVQSPSKTFATAGTHTVALIATNGAGSAVKVQSFFTAPAGAAVLVPPSSERIPFAASGPDRRHAAVELSGEGAAWLRLSSSSSVEETLFLRFLDANGELVQERRLAMQAGSTVSHDLNAYGLKGSFTLELVGESSVAAAVIRTGRSTTVIHR